MLRVSFAIADIDECALPTGGHICSYRCINVPGSFQCSCPSTGYRLAPNGRNCQGEWGRVPGSPRPSRGSAGWGEPEAQQPQHRWGAFRGDDSVSWVCPRPTVTLVSHTQACLFSGGSESSCSASGSPGEAGSGADSL